MRRSWRFEKQYRRWLKARGHELSSRERLPHLVAEYVRGKSRLCRETLILRTETIPEMDLPGAAVYLPHLAPRDQQRWLGMAGQASQLAVGGPFRPEVTYANWFWLMSPSCVRLLLNTAGFSVTRHLEEAFSATFVATVAGPAMVHTPDAARITVTERHFAPMI